MQFDRKTVMVAIASAVIGALAIVVWNSRGSYEQCIIDEMRGQPSNMNLVVITACAKRYGKIK